MSPLASYRRLFTLAGPLYVAVAFVGRLPLAMAQMGTLLLVATWYVLVNIVVDVLYTVSDPRVRLRANRVAARGRGRHASVAAPQRRGGHRFRAGRIANRGCALQWRLNSFPWRR